MLEAFNPSPAVGVGRKFNPTTTGSSPWLLPSNTRGANEASLWSLAVGVGRVGDDDEESGAPVGRSGVGSSDNSPPDRHPQFGNVSEDRVKAQSEVTSDVLQDRVSRSKDANGIADVRPKVSLIVGAFPFTCMTERLAGVATRQHIYGGDGCPINGGDVAKVGDAGVVRGEDVARGGFNL